MDFNVPPLPPPKHQLMPANIRTTSLESSRPPSRSSDSPLPLLPPLLPPPRHPSTARPKSSPVPQSLKIGEQIPVSPPLEAEENLNSNSETESEETRQFWQSNNSPASELDSLPPTPDSDWREEEHELLESRAEEDELLESLADQIALAVDSTRAAQDTAASASAGAEDDEDISLVGGFTGLRRRFSTISGVMEQRPTASETDGQRELRQALEDLEDTEVADFLARVGKQVKEVRIAVPAEDVPLPSREEFARPDGTTDWVVFAVAYFTSTAIRYTPSSLLAAPPPTRFSLHLAKNHVERLYVLCPPPLLDAVLHGALADVYRWKSPNTWKYCLLYSFLWIFDLIPLLPFGTFLFYLLRQRLYPPTTAEVLALSHARQIRAAEAAELSKQLSSTTRLSFTVDSAKDLISGLMPTPTISKLQGSSLMRGLQGSALLGGLVGGAGGVKVDANGVATSKAPRKKEVNPGGALARGLASAVSAGGVGGPQSITIEAIRPLSDPGDISTRAPDGSVSLYTLAKEILRVFGPLIQEYMNQASDLGEKVKNLFLHSDHPSVPLVCLRLAAVCIFIILCPAWILIKLCWAYLGIEFFVLWRLRELYPRWRRALAPVWWVLYDAPTDAEYATYILQKRSRAHKPLRGSKTLKRMAKDRARAGSVEQKPKPIPPKDLGTSVLGGTTLAMMGMGMVPSASGSNSALLRTISSRSDEVQVIGTYFALFHTTPGSLILTPTRIRFAPTRGFRTLRMKLNRPLASSSTSAPDSDDGASISSFGTASEEKDSIMLDLATADVVGCKKEKRVGFEGMQIEAKDGNVYRFSNVSKRDDAFNKIVASSPSAWTQS